MYLKSIEVQGFKSFANKICFEFHNGITGIVGPNGSGKSNVADAVRWVLGEQSAKQLRGGNMQDVIFSGTETRKPLGFASVAITLDNSDHKLPIEYEEVTVTRRLYRSGESEYLLNGTGCRLKDIHELFYDTGIGKEGYSIIGQGQIDKILSGKPEERRELFDEAAGIVKFKRRKNTALKKLSEEQQNLVRVSDILSELTKQLEPLEKQSETARVYLKKKEELKTLDVNMFLLDMENGKKQLSEIAGKHQIAERELNEATAAFEQTKQEYEELERDMEALDTKIEQSREQANQDTLTRQRLESQISLLKEQINTSIQSDSYYQSRLKELTGDLDKRRLDIQQYQSEKAKLDEEISQADQKRSSEESRLELLTVEIESCTAAVENSKNEIIEILNKRASTKGKMQRYDAMLEQINIRKAQLNQRLLQIKSEEVQQSEVFEQHKAKYEELSALRSEMSGRQEQMEAEVAALQQKIQEQNKQMEIGQTAYHREASRLESLKNITERYEGYGGSIRRVMEQKAKNSGIKGVVADLIKAEKKYETAIETALGGSIQNIVTDNENTAKYMIEFLKRGRYGRATFLPLTNMRAKTSFQNQNVMQEKGVIGFASTLVATEPQYDALVAQLLGKTLVVDHIDHAIAIGNKYKHSFRMVTLEGESLSPGGSMTGGAFKNNSNLLGRRREIEDLERSVKMLKKDMDAMQAEIEAHRNQRNTLRDELVVLSDQMQEHHIRQNTAKIKMRQAESKITEVQSGYTQLKSEGREIEAQVREIEASNQSIVLEMEASEEQQQKEEQIVREQQALLDERHKLETEYKSRLEDIHLECAGIAQKNQFLNENIQRIKSEIDTISSSIGQIQKEAEEVQSDRQKKENDILEIQKTIGNAVAAAGQNEEQIQAYLSEKEEMTKGHKTFFARRDELSQHINRMDKECYRLGSQKEKLEEHQENQINYMWEEYELTPHQAGELRLNEIPEQAVIRKSIGRLKDEIRSLGAVNVNAIEDFKNLQERHSFLSTQHSDLVEAEATLLGIVDELDTAMRKQFTEKFEEIRLEFDRVFKQLFGGGKGTLELMEEEDVLEAGIKIISQPPGKKLQNMMQLSGGEKALTAIALLFAIQNLKPSPFCLLDEIEAALDDSNVVRFAKYLHKLTKNTQFIIITHRRGTMVAADRLYGITMQEKGISTLVSVNLIENELDK